MTHRPAIFVYVTTAVPPRLVEAVIRGAEEQGVPWHLVEARGDAEVLARRAAESSALFVGVGLDDFAVIAVHEHRLGGRPTLILLSDATEGDARIAGGDAARLVLGRMLRGRLNRGSVE